VSDVGVTRHLRHAVVRSRSNGTRLGVLLTVCLATWVASACAGDECSSEDTDCQANVPRYCAREDEESDRYVWWEMLPCLSEKHCVKAESGNPHTPTTTFCVAEPEPSPRCLGGSSEIRCDGDSYLQCKYGWVVFASACRRCEYSGSGWYECSGEYMDDCVSTDDCASGLECLQLGEGTSSRPVCSLQCDCPPGQSCEDCAPAQLRSSRAPYTECVAGTCGQIR
jgi:hypothetical protein